jgi:hypothetical protein
VIIWVAEAIARGGGGMLIGETRLINNNQDAQ